MIRYITFSRDFLEIKKNGVLAPGITGFFNTRDQNYITFEKDWKGDAFFKVMFLLLNSVTGVSLHPNDLVALVFDEHDLLVKGYQFYDIPESNDYLDLESMLNKKEISEEEYKEVGKFVYLKGEIPLAYLKNIDIPEEKRLQKIRLI